MPAPSFLIMPGAHHELVADDLGVGGGFLEGGNEELGGFHRMVAIGLEGCTHLPRIKRSVHNGLQFKNLGFDYA
jgi:hypothetical protein